MSYKKSKTSSASIITQHNPILRSRTLYLTIEDDYTNRQKQFKRHLIDKIDNKNVNEYIDTNDYAFDISYSIIFMKEFGLSIRALELLYLFNKIPKKVYSQNMLFKLIRNMEEKPQYVQTHQDNKKTNNIWITFKELLDNKIIIKEDPDSKFSAFIINEKLFSNKEYQNKLMKSIDEMLHKNKIGTPPLILKLNKKITEMIELKD